MGEWELPGAFRYDVGTMLNRSTAVRNTPHIYYDTETVTVSAADETDWLRNFVKDEVKKEVQKQVRRISEMLMTGAKEEDLEAFLEEFMAG